MAFGGFFNRFYYGKAGQADFTPDQLPTNRVSLFFETLRVRFSGIIGINLLYVVFCLPAIIWTLINVLTLINGLTAVQEGTLESYDLVKDGYLFIYLVGMVPCLALAGVGAPGEMYVLRNWARDQHAFLWSDFKDALKANWKMGLVIGLINGLSFLISYVCYVFYGQMSQENWIFVIPQALVMVMLLIWWMMNMVIYPMMVTYDLKFKGLLRNSAIMVIARLPLSFLFLLGTAGLPFAVIYLIPHLYTYLIVAAIYLILGFGLTGFLYASYANSCFDRYLNPKIEGAPVNLGLREKDADEDDDEDDPNPVA